VSRAGGEWTWWVCAVMGESGSGQGAVMSVLVSEFGSEWVSAAEKSHGE
jgi:hypothetical protein